MPKLAAESVMRGQLRHSMDLVGGDRITLQVMLYRAVAHSGLDGPFFIFGMPVPGMDVIMVDNVASAVYLQDDDGVQRFRALFDALRASALGPAPSLEWLRQVATDL
ncbi:Scr1 family TA system antitoxin-like transcriptional regulator [Streptomyces sp. RKAG337]|uniref:Scr1 family TA system antitoxin-like transcriptional regulator n=1 Tax=Streptomyces sp. RKAG337 TaxID=2893404 RepID=UPI0020344296|nr:Scr1 family TA system antitoxin-like transcriptional regulator [Streptomyces sp. RKAG337]